MIKVMIKTNVKSNIPQTYRCDHCHHQYEKRKIWCWIWEQCPQIRKYSAGTGILGLAHSDCKSQARDLDSVF